MVLTTLLATVGLAAAAAPASASVADATCAGSVSSTFSPGLRANLLPPPPPATTATESAALTGCVSLSVPAITSGTIVPNGNTESGNCVAVNPTVTDVIGINWNNGTSSVVFVTDRVAVNAAAVRTVTLTGVVVAGTFFGQAAVIVFTSPLDPLDCLSASGLTSTTGVVTLAIT
ncbi:hypothetical protein GCM10022243_22170 [Saccharothrix violaceirubra]